MQRSKDIYTNHPIFKKYQIARLFSIKNLNKAISLQDSSIQAKMEAR